MIGAPIGHYAGEDPSYHFMVGAKSPAAKEYWLEQFRQNNELYIALKLKGIYSEEEVKKILLTYALDCITLDDHLITTDWFESFKKKQL